MLNLSAFDKDDISLLVNSYNSIRNKDHLEITCNEDEKQEIFQKTVRVLTLPVNCSFSFQNLFKIRLNKGHFYIAQCLLDFGYPVGRKLDQSPIRKYHYQVVGIAHSTIDLGKTYMRPETKSDKLIGLFDNIDIDFDDLPGFSDKYYLASNQPDQIKKVFDKQFVNSIAKHNNIHLFTKSRDIFITFDDELKAEQAGAIADILTNFKFHSEE